MILRFSKFLFITFSSILLSCNDRTPKEKEQSLSLADIDTTISAGLKSNNSFTQLNATPNAIILTGLPNVRLISIYKIPNNGDKNILYDEGTTYDERDENEFNEVNYRYYMPGIDIIRGYNLVNIAHYQSDKDSLSYFFNRPVLIRTLYFPGVKNDSLEKNPVFRNFFLVSVYESDTNNDSLINNKDLRRLYFINETNSEKISLLPENFSTIRSTYDYKRDIMFIHARNDKNKNGKAEKDEPVSIFMLDLKNPKLAKKVI